jgi:putative hydrolase of the HAD superfamily
MIAAVVRAGPLLREARPRTALRPADLDAVTVDAFGTLLRLRDPVGHLRGELAARGVTADAAAVERGFRAEAEHYRREKLAAGDAESLARLREDCARVFLGAAGVDLDPAGFASAFALPYEPVAGASEAVARLAGLGLSLAVVANWDYGLHSLLERHGLGHRFAVVVVAAETGAAKPDPAPFALALDRLGVAPERALHVGDEAADRDGARAAGLHFAPAPLARAVEALP